MAWNGHKVSGPPEMGMTPLMGNETPARIITLAYGMEAGLGLFYAILAERTDDAEMSGLLNRLRGIEEKHKEKLFKLYLTFSEEPVEKETFETSIIPDMMEGGFTTEEFIEQNHHVMKDVSGVLDVAMMLETQAFDLYSRYSQKTGDENTRNILHGIAEEEKAHLSALGDLMERRA